MDPTILATIIGLICNYRQEVANREAGEQESFQQWLDNDRHQKVMDLLRKNTFLAEQVQQIIDDSSGRLQESLGLISQSMSLVLSRIDGFSALQDTLSPESNLSDQAIGILRQFVESGATMMECMSYGGSKMLLFIHEDGRAPAFLPAEQRFLISDLNNLCSAGLLDFGDFSSSGEARYIVTRPGEAYVKQLPSNHEE